MNLPETLGAITVSDLHLYHPRVSTTTMVDSVIGTIRREYVPGKIHYLIITGDIYDRPVQTDTEAGKEISRFISFVLDFAARHDLVLIVLRGTGSHDGNQPGHFVSINEGRIDKADLTYVDKISIWTDRYGVRWLGVPDEASPSTLQTKAKIESLMKEMGITEVDMAVTHGTYNTHNLNGYVDEEGHDTKWYMSIVKYLILNGHIHFSSLVGTLLTIGSFGRYRHGEEEPKGGWKIFLNRTKDEVTTEFICNEKADLFLTHALKAKTIQKAYREIEEFIVKSGLLRGGYLKVAYPNEMDVNELIRQLQVKYHPDIVFSTKKLDDKETSDSINDRVVEFEKITTVPITRETAASLLEDKLTRMNVANIDKVIEAFNSIN